MQTSDIIIVGAGISGLCCARQLKKLGFSSLVLESSSVIGGRVKTDNVNGFLLDRGFQVFLTAYPEARRILDYEKLNLKYFAPGALVRSAGNFHPFYDPLRHPSKLFSSLFSPIGSFGDKFRIAYLKHRVGHGDYQRLFQHCQLSTIDLLEHLGFTERIIKQFFKPFFGGIFLDNQLTTPSRMFEFIFQMFSQGSATLPHSGMSAIPEQIASKLLPESIKTKQTVHSVKDNCVRLTTGEELHAKAIILATASHTTEKLLGLKPQNTHRVSCLYFDAPSPPIADPILVLNGDSHGPINNLCVLNKINPNYAPKNSNLVSATVIGGMTSDIERQVKLQLKSWFGKQTSSWSLIKTYDIKDALPIITSFSNLSDNHQISEGLFTCGDYRSSPSLQGAMVSGRDTANAVASFLRDGVSKKRLF